MLGDLEVEVENTNEKMNFVMGKLSKLLKTKGESDSQSVSHDLREMQDKNA